MARQRVAIAGGVVGFQHLPGAYLLDGGRSLHPLQRQGVTPAGGMVSVPAQARHGLGGAPYVGAGPDLGYPHTMTPGIALNPALRV